MSLTQSELVGKFVNGAERGKASHMFIDGDIIYSYGTHFPLLIRMVNWGGNKFLLNADKYSISTTKQQTMCLQIATVQIPFSALQSALGVSPYELIEKVHEIDLLDKSEPRYDLIGYFTYEEDGKKKRITKEKYASLPDEEKVNYDAYHERRPESSLLRYDDRLFLSSMDEDLYFIAELPPLSSGLWESPQDLTVDNAFNTLKPKPFRGLTERLEYERQGEWFFIDITDYMGLKTKTARIRQWESLTQRFTLPRRNDSDNPHTATRGGFLVDFPFEKSPTAEIEGLEAETPVVAGRVHHPEHRVVRLSGSKDPRFFAAFENNAVNSWSAVGDVD